MCMCANEFWSFRGQKRERKPMKLQLQGQM